MTTTLRRWPWALSLLALAWGRPAASQAQQYIGGNLVTNGTFSTRPAGAVAAGADMGGWSSNRPYGGNLLYPAEGSLSDQAGSVSYSAGNVVQGSFPGDASNGVGASSTWLLYNGNTANAPFIWSQTLPIVGGAAYRITLYASNATAPTVSGRAVPSIAFYSSDATGARYGGFGSVLTLPEENTANGGQDVWTRHQVTLSGTVSQALVTRGGANSFILNILDNSGATTAAGGDVAITNISMQRINQVPRGQQTAPTVFGRQGAVAIPTLRAIDPDPDGSVASYKVTALPPAAQGTLLLNGAAVRINQILTSTEAAALSFDPNTGFSGNALFTYTATDNLGGESLPLNYGIPVNNASCNTQSLFNFGTRTAGEDWTTSKNATVDGVVITSTYTGPTVAATTATTLVISDETGNDPTTAQPGNGLVWTADYGVGTAAGNRSSSIKFSFTNATGSSPKLLNNFTMVVGDIDRASAAGVTPPVGFVDQAIFSGTDANGNTVTLTSANVAVAPTNTFSSPNSVVGTDNSGSPAGNIVLSFPVPVKDVTVTYTNQDPAADPARQKITLLFLSWCGEADLATTISGPATAAAGQTVYYYATTTNNGPRPATNEVTTITLPGKPAASTVNVPNGTYDASTGIVTFNATTLAVNATAVNYVSFVMPSGITTFAGQAKSSALETDNTLANNDGSAGAANVTTTVGATGATGTALSCPPNPGKDGTPAIATAPNMYYLPSGNASAGQKVVPLSATSLTGTGATTGATNLAVGDLVMLVQMQGSTIDASNTDSYGDGVAGGTANGTTSRTAGTYEYAVVNAAYTAGTSANLTLRDNLTNSYTLAAATTTAGRQTYQVIRIPQYAALTLNGTISPPAWNGQLGGVLALDVAGPLNLNGNSLDASGKGFRGGGGRKLGGVGTTAGYANSDYRLSGANATATANSSTGGSKGEGTAGTPIFVSNYSASATAGAIANTGAANGYPNGDNGRGAPGTAGGGGTDGSPSNNFQNSGGGGGANGGRGGRGGNTWQSILTVGGEPGAAFPVASSSRLVLGGGGGAGSNNDGTGTGTDGRASSGAPGGGIILVRTGFVQGTGSIVANGYSADNSVANDGSGGGGAGGSVLVTANNTSTLGSLTLAANGGAGGTNTGNNGTNSEAHGPGGGGGGGVVFVNGPVAAATTTPGLNGTTITAQKLAFGAESGTVGVANVAISNSVAASAADASCVSDLATVISGPTSVATTGTVNLAVSFTNNGALVGNNVTRVVSLPLGLLNVTAPGGTISTTASAITITYPPLTTLASGASSTFAISYTAPATGGVTATSTIGQSSAANPDPYTTNNTSSVTTTVGAFADVTTTITGPASVNPGLATGNFTANFTNNGPLAAANVTRAVTLPAGATITAAQLTALQATYGAGTTYSGGTGGTLTFPTVGTLAASTTSTVSFPITASATPGAATIQSNTTTTTTQGANTLPDAASFGFAVAPLADVAVTVTNNNAGTVTAGGTGTFAVTLTNNGPSAATNVVATVQLLPGLSNVVATNGGVYDASTGVVTYASIASQPAGTSGNASSTITFLMPNSPVVASASVNTDTNEGTNTANNTATATILNAANFDVTTRISAPASAAAGTSVTLSVVTQNAGPGTAPSTTQTVVIPGVFTNLYVSNGGTYANDGTNTTVTFPAVLGLASGANVNNSITLTMPATALNNITATVAAAGETNNLANTATASVATATATAGNVNLYTTISPATAAAPTTVLTAPVVPGTTLVLNVTTGNYGPSVATNAVTQVALPAGLTGVVASNNGTYDATTGLVSFPATSSLAQGATVAYTIQLAAPTTGPLMPVASITSASAETVPADNVATTKVDIMPLADVTTAIVGPNAPTVGQPARYAVTTTNNGPSVAMGVVQTVLLPLGLPAVTVTDANNNTVAATYNAATGLLTLPASAVANGNLVAGAAVVNYVSFATPASTGYPVTAAVVTTSTESNTNNNSATVVTTPVPTADVSVALSGPASTLQGNAVTYTVATSNAGSSVNPSSTTTVQLPAGLTNVQVSGGGSYNNGTGIVTFPAISNQAVGAAGAVSNTITFIAPTATPITVTAQVAVTPAGNDPNLNNNSATINTDVTPSSTTQVDESTTIAATVGGNPASDTNPAIAGSAVTFTVTSVNANNAPATAATNVIQRVQLPAGLSGLTISNSGTYDPATGVVTFPTVASQANNSASPSYTITVPATPGNSPNLTATAYVSTANSDTNPANNAVSVTVPVALRADVTTTITGPATTSPNSSATYLVTTRNVGPSEAASVNTTVQLPTGLLGVVVSSGGSYDTNSGLVTFPTVTSLPGYSGTVAANAAAPQLTYTITMPAPSTITATNGYAVTSTVSTATTETTTANNSASVPTVAANQPPVASNLVNTLQAPEGNTGVQMPLSPLAATDPDGSVASYQLVSLPTSGTLFYNNGGTYTAITTTNLAGGTSQLNLTPTQAQTLRYTPGNGFVGNAFFTYRATDNGNPALASNTALYTIPVNQDLASLYALTPVKGGANGAYNNGDVIGYVVDNNGALYSNNGTSLVYSTAGVLQANADNGVRTVVPAATFTSSTTTGVTTPAQLGLSIDPTTGLITVADRTLLKSGTYVLNITTTDANGGVNTQAVTIRIPSAPLPVVLTAFTAQTVQNRDALLSWATASELNSDYFDVERSFDGRTFTKVGQVAAQGTTSAATTYTFTDAAVASRATGAVYYRLRQVDHDATASYSPVRTVSFTKVVSVALSLYPNPAQTTTRLDLSQLPASGTYQVQLLDATGRLVRAASLAGGLAQTLDLADLATGTYHVLVTGTLADGSALRQTLRLTKE